MSNGRIDLQGKEMVSLNTSIFSQFPIIRVLSPDELNETLLLYVFHKDGIPEYAVLGRFVLGYLPKSDDEELIQWLGHLRTLLNFDPLSQELNSDYLNEMLEIQKSHILNKIELTQEGFDILSGKFNFLPNGRIQRTVLMEVTTEDNAYYFGKKYEVINKENSILSDKAFNSYQKYMHNYFLNQEDLINMTYDQAKAFALFHRYRIVKHIRATRPEDEWLQGDCNEALSTDFENSSMAAIKLLDSIVAIQLNSKCIEEEKKAL